MNGGYCSMRGCAGYPVDRGWYCEKHQRFEPEKPDRIEATREPQDELVLEMRWVDRPARKPRRSKERP